MVVIILILITVTEQRRFNGQRHKLRLNFSGKVRAAEIQQTHTSRLSWAGISPDQAERRKVGGQVVTLGQDVMSPLTDTDN